MSLSNRWARDVRDNEKNRRRHDGNDESTTPHRANTDCRTKRSMRADSTQDHALRYESAIRTSTQRSTSTYVATRTYRLTVTSAPSSNVHLLPFAQSICLVVVDHSGSAYSVWRTGLLKILIHPKNREMNWIIIAIIKCVGIAREKAFWKPSPTFCRRKNGKVQLVFLQLISTQELTVKKYQL